MSSFGGDVASATGATAITTGILTASATEASTQVLPTATGAGAAASTSESEGRLRRSQQRADGILFAAIFAAVAYL